MRFYRVVGCHKRSCPTIPRRVDQAPRRVVAHAIQLVLDARWSRGLQALIVGLVAHRILVRQVASGINRKRLSPAGGQRTVAGRPRLRDAVQLIVGEVLRPGRVALVHHLVNVVVVARRASRE
jgi:hypothetical protein